MVETPVSLLDIPATLLDVVGAEPVTLLDGRSLLPTLLGETLDDQPAISEYHGEGVMRPCFMIRLGPWKYIYIHGASPQLFNVAQDPDEWNNLAGDPATRDIEAQLRSHVVEGAFDLDFLDFIEQDVSVRLAQKQIVRGGSDCLNRVGVIAKWISVWVKPLPGLAAAR